MLIASSQLPASQIMSVPDASDEDWQHRLEKRRLFIDHVKSEAVYADRAKGSGQARPLTPDATSRTSKRAWEKAAAEWRKGLRPP